MAEVSTTASPEPYVAWKHWRAEDFGRFSPRDAAHFAAEITPLLDGTKRASVLEIGFGNGVLLGWLNEQGHDAVGVEVSPELVQRARAAGINAFDSLKAAELAIRRGSFDCVAAFDVLEHVTDRALPGLVADVKDLLRPGGTLFARFPNGDSPFGRVYQHGDVTHAATIGHLKIHQLAAHAGLEVRAFRAPALLTMGSSLRGRMEKRLAAGVRGTIERFCSKLYFSGERICLAPNAVAILQRPLS